MKRITTVLTIAALGALIIAPASEASPRVDAGKQAKAFAAKQCAAQAKRAPRAFKARFGKVRKQALAACVRSGTEDLVAEVGAAVQACADELIADPSGFLSDYGSEESPIGMFEAFPNCVRSKMGTEIQNRIDAFIAAGRDCLDQARSDPEAFRDTYGQDDGPLAALGRCVDTQLAAG